MPLRARFLTLAAITALIIVASFGAAATASADPGDIGFADHSSAPLGNSPTASKPESKLWYAGGQWWSVMFNGAASQWRIYQLNTTTNVWSDTGVNADARDNTRADTLFDPANNKLYLTSHIFTTSAGSTSASAANSARLYRYSFSGGSFSLDSGFPVTINTATSETVTIDKDSAGTLWATWVAGSNVYVNHSTGGDGTTWGTAYIVPGSAAVSSDDISSLVHYGGNKIGVMWSKQSSPAQWLFATHTDGTGDAAANWTTQVVPTGASPDDHINLKAGDDGRVYAAIKTSESTSTRPLVQLAVRATNGTWSVSTYGTKANRLTRPIVELDEESNVVHIFVTCPGANDSNGEDGGDICTKSTPMSSLAFSTGPGTSIIRDFNSAEMNDATSTKQNVTSSMGLVVMANNPTLDRYWHSANVLGGSPPPPGVTANFTGTPTSGTAQLAVQFTDTSTGSPTSWSWSFGDGGTSTAQNPSHTYTDPGTYTVSLTANNGGTPSTETKVGYITVNPSGGGGGGTTTFTPVADAHVRDTAPTSNYGTITTLRVRTDAAGDDYRTLLKFTVSNLTGPVTDAKLRLFVTDASPDGGRVYAVDSGWTETGVNWNNAPSISGLTPIASIGTTAAVGSWTEVDLGSAVTANGTYAFELVSSSTNSAIYNSREAATNKPELVLTSGTGGEPPPVSANFSGTPTSGTAPLDVLFTDSSTGDPTGWSWSFGDSGTSTQQNPQHTYSVPGTYTVSLTVSKSGVPDSTQTLTNYITVNPDPGPGGGGTSTFLAAADAHVRDTAATTNYGGITTLRVRTDAAGDDYRSLVKFNVSGLSGTISTAKLRLWVTDVSPDSGRVYLVSNSWTELNPGGVTWNTAPSITGLSSIASFDTTTVLESWVEVEVGAALTGNGTYSVELVSSSTNSAIYSSREGAHPPELVITTT